MYGRAFMCMWCRGECSVFTKFKVQAVGCRRRRGMLRASDKLKCINTFFYIWHQKKNTHTSKNTSKTKIQATEYPAEFSSHFSRKHSSRFPIYISKDDTTILLWHDSKDKTQHETIQVVITATIV